MSQSNNAAISSFGEYLRRIIPSAPIQEEKAPQEEPEKDLDSLLEELEESFGEKVQRVDEVIEPLLKPKAQVPAPAPKPAPKPKPVPVEEPVAQFEGYRVVRDKDENFECNITVEGTSLSEAKVRLVLDSDSHNLIYYGTLSSSGKCVVPLKKGIPLLEGTEGKIRLEVIAEDQLFVGWEDSFRVEAAKKLKVELKEQKSVKVDFKR